MEVYIYRFLSNLPSSKGFDFLFTVVDWFTKMTHFLPCTKTINSQGTTNLVTREVFQCRGCHNDIISDQGPQFISTVGNTSLGSSKLVVNSLQAII